MKRDLTEALAIAQELLDITGASLLSGNFTGFADCFSLPTIFDTYDGQVRLDTIDDLEARFRDVTAHYRSIGTTEMVRHIVAADWFDERTIHSTHESRILAGTTLMQVPFIVFSVLKNTGTRWQITFSQYAIPDSEQYNKALIGANPIKGDTNV